MKAVVQEQLREAKGRDTKYAIINKSRKSLGVLDARTSESTKQVKGRIDMNTMEKVFGGD